MRRALGVILLMLGTMSSLLAAHIRGGEMYYKYLRAGIAPNSSVYLITLKLYIDCNQNSPGQLDDEVPFTIFSKPGRQQVANFMAPMTNEQFIRYNPASNPCITNPPTDVCYRLRYFSYTIELTNTLEGYTIAYQRCCRIAGIQNVAPPSDSYGATYFCEIPGTAVLAGAYKNSSPQFNPDDAVAVCFGSNFTFDFSAVDEDVDPTGKKTDSIVYMLCEAYTGGGPGGGGGGGSNCQNCPSPNPAAAPNAPPNPTYNPIPYQSPYSGSTSMGPRASIDSKTGLLSGIAPAREGQYVVTVCAQEYRLGVLINTHHKDIHIRVSDCIPLKAKLNPDYAYCDDFLVRFRNEQVNPPGTLFIWNYGDGTKPDTIANVDGEILHQYMVAGDYLVKLKVILAGQCVDSTTTIAKVYPGFNPDFAVQGSCVLIPIKFIDHTVSQYGVPDKWRWNFGDETTQADTAITANPSWKYATTGFKTVQLIVGSSKGCIDTLVVNNVEVKDKPTITLAFNDTLICSNRPVQDTLQLHASGLGVFSWTPLVDILDPNTPDPLVFPNKTTTYQVELNENGCVNTASVRVRTLSFVSLNAGRDSTICLTDTVQLKPVTDGLYFTWSSNPTSPINDPKARQPLVSPTAITTTYSVFAEVGKCNATDEVKLFTIPYPTANAGPDTTVCFEDTASLHASMIGYRFLWAPTQTLSNPTVLNPLAFPRNTTTYILRVTDTLGCPKPKFDSVKVTVRPEILAFAGNDTSIVAGQPLQLRGTGAEFIEWSPSNFLNTTRSDHPIALLNDHFTYYMRAFTSEGCFDLDTINVRVFKTMPDIFVPNAFRPTGSQNNVLRPVLVGISNLEFFRVYNRWGQMVFQTTQHGKGWDGTLGGKAQSAGTYVWMVRGKDYTGKTVTKRGAAVLIR